MSVVTAVNMNTNRSLFRH